MEPDPRHALPAPKGPGPLHWWALRIFGAVIMIAVLVIYFSGTAERFPTVARQYLMGALFVVGLLIFTFGWLIRWILEG